jgi:hypothetical protein
MKTREMALHFLDSVREDIGDPAYWDAIWTNVNFPKQGVCRLHDWCDANMNMMDTIEQFMPSAHSAYWNRPEGGTDVDHIELHYESIWNDVYSESFVVMQEESKGFETIGACTTCGSNIVGPPEMRFTHNFCGAHE